MVSRFWCTALVGLIAACGSSVSTSGSASTHGSGSGGGNSTVNVTVSTGTGPSPNDPKFCDKFCVAVGDCFGDCQAVCKSYLLAPCDAVGGQLASCIAGNLDLMTCAYTQGVCDDLRNAFTACRAKTQQNCPTVTGAAGATFCEKTGECTGGEERAICDIQSGMAVCTCYLNALAIGTCTAEATMTACDLKGGCCHQFFGS